MKTWVQIAAGVIAAIWIQTPITVQVLLGLMVADVITGLLQAYVNQTLDSSVSFKGIVRKTIILIIIVASHLLHHLLETQGYHIPLDVAVAGFYVVHESLSVIENAILAGLPVPQALKDALVKIEGSDLDPAKSGLKIDASSDR